MNLEVHTLFVVSICSALTFCSKESLQSSESCAIIRKAEVDKHSLS